jgi:Flp pilus assembly protein TadD
MVGRPDRGFVDTAHDPAEQQMRARVLGALFGGDVKPVKVDRYVVLDQIGSGGLGVVYAAYDPELDRKVALKLVNPARLTPQAAARMQREAQAMAKVRHPNVVAVHDAGPHGEGVFIAMELVEGVTLSAWKRAQERPWKVVRDVIVSAGRGLSAAHRQGLVHRDFKPANVLVDREGQARVLDFGLARAAETGELVRSATGLLDADLTQTGTLLGTPAYMAPEQFEGRADAQSDQWGFCVTAYEMLYGGRPFGGLDANAMRDATRAGKIPMPHASSTVPSWMFRALCRGMSVDPALRYASMDALLVALQRDKRSRRVGIAAVVIAVVLSSAGTAGALWAAREQPNDESRALVDQLDREAREAAEAGWFVYPSPDEPELPTALVKVIALEQLEGPIADEAKARAAELRREFAGSLVELGDRYWESEMAFASDYYAAALLFDPATERARERSTLTPGELAVLRGKASKADFSEAEVVGAAPLAALAEEDPQVRDEKVRRLLNAERGTADSTTRRLAKLVGEVEREPENAAIAFTEPPRTVLPSRGHAPPREEGSKRDPDNARAEAAAGQAALRRGADAEAEQAFHRALSKDGDNVTALVGLGEIHFQRGAYQKALTYAKKASIAAPKRASIRMQLGDAYYKLHRYDDARREYETAQKLGASEAAQALKRIDARVGHLPSK